MVRTFSRRRVLALGAAAGLAVVSAGALAQTTISLLNVSYDPTRELYQEFNAAFIKHWKAQNGRGRRRSSNRTAVPASRRAASSTGSRPTW